VRCKQEDLIQFPTTVILVSTQVSVLELPLRVAVVSSLGLAEPHHTYLVQPSRSGDDEVKKYDEEDVGVSFAGLQ
jgi:hypothetical protein